MQATLRLKNSTLGIIKPHCIKDGLCSLYIIYMYLKQRQNYDIFTGNLGRIISEITNNGFKITGLRINLMERVNCEEFFEVYRGILPEYIVSILIQYSDEIIFTNITYFSKPMVAQLASGVSIALEIVAADENKNSYEEFRQFCGPMDPVSYYENLQYFYNLYFRLQEIAKMLRPHTLRAKFGVSKTLNAVHCTDLPDDTILELQYIFKILD